ncbi:SleB Cell wall hydrolyses involved in spore germination [uncultured Caudovirales phage]|uniref:SleB Cell wall hydrolyses involved in spore germination n=1 Tax=uncultured Caudovirales phage TaxID=2100421 RepID=A0A6J5LJ78_9CAUD|nr:SleB Cell wall hydrolyses involved in spore germination [uncultured Caudovirales phage]
MKQALPSMAKFVAIIFGMWLATFSLVAVTKAKFESLRVEKAQMQNTKVVTSDDRARQLRCLTQNIYWEAASEPFEGKVAVAQVTMNRAASSQFPNDVCAVVYQKNVIYSKVVCQFSWYCEGTHRVKPVYQPLYRESEEVAKKVLLENFRLPSLKNALYYHADYVKPGWGKIPIAKIGHHVFYGS